MDNHLDFLRTILPFDLLPEDVLQGVVGLLQEVPRGRELTLYL